MITNLAVAGLEPVQEPAMDKEGGIEGVFVGVAVGVLVGNGVLVGGTLIQEPVTLSVTEDNFVVLYVTVIVPLPAPS